MAGSTTSTHSAVIIPQVHQEISDAVFRNSEFLPLFRQIGPVGGSTYDVKVVTAANSSAQVYTEDQAVPSPGYQQTITAAASWKHVRVFDRVTGHLRRQLNSSWDSPAWPGAYGGSNFEAEKAKEDLVDLVNTTFLANATYGLVGIVDDDTTNYYDQSRSTYTALKSYVKTASAALSAALMNRLVHETYNAPYGGKLEAILMPPAQARKYSALVEGKVQVTGMGDIAGSGPAMLPPWGRIPCFEVRDLSATVIIGLSGMDSSWFFAIHEAAPGGIDILPYGVTADAKINQYSTAGALICTQPNRQGKLETLGTT